MFLRWNSNIPSSVSLKEPVPCSWRLNMSGAVQLNMSWGKSSSKKNTSCIPLDIQAQLLRRCLDPHSHPKTPNIRKYLEDFGCIGIHEATWVRPSKKNIIAPENGPSQKETSIFQTSNFRGYVKLRGRGNFCFYHRFKGVVILMTCSPVGVARGDFWIFNFEMSKVLCPCESWQPNKSLDIQTPPEKVFGPPKPTKNTFQGGIWMSRECIQNQFRFWESVTWFTKLPTMLLFSFGHVMDFMKFAPKLRGTVSTCETKPAPSPLETQVQTCFIC